jgi:hypothetical protein
MQTGRVTDQSVGAPTPIYPSPDTGDQVAPQLEETGLYFLRVQNLGAVVVELLDVAGTKAGEGFPLAAKGETWMLVGGEEHIEAIAASSTAEVAFTLSRAGAM